MKQRIIYTKGKHQEWGKYTVDLSKPIPTIKKHPVNGFEKTYGVPINVVKLGGL